MEYSDVPDVIVKDLTELLDFCDNNGAYFTYNYYNNIITYLSTSLLNRSNAILLPYKFTLHRYKTTYSNEKIVELFQELYNKSLKF